MKKNLIIGIVLLVYLVGFWLYYKNIIVKQPGVIVDLQTQLADKKRQLLSAQIISKNLQNVNDLIQNNLVSTPYDSLAKPANMEFLKYLTGLMDKYDIILVSMRPLDIIQATQNQNSNQQNIYQQNSGNAQVDDKLIQIPYSMSLLANYIEFGMFLQELEKSPRLIKVVRLSLDNPLDYSYFEDEVAGKPDQRKFNLDIHTMTIVKASYKGGQE
jgi:hypothetical protein